MLIHVAHVPRLLGMKKQVANLPLEAVLQAAKLAGQDAARNAVNAGRVVAGWKDGMLVEYGPGALSQRHQIPFPIPSEPLEDEYLVSPAPLPENPAIKP